MAPGKSTADKVTVIPCGAMTADLTWLLIKPGMSITDSHYKDAPPPWVDVPTPCVLVETDEGRVLWDTSFEGPEFETVAGDTDFLPGIKLIETPGHTVGTMSMQVDPPDTGSMIFTSDAVYMGGSYGPPATPAAIVNNLEDVYSAGEKLRGVQERTGAQMIFGHDAEQIHQLRVGPDGSYT